MRERKERGGNDAAGEGEEGCFTVVLFNFSCTNRKKGCHLQQRGSVLGQVQQDGRFGCLRAVTGPVCVGHRVSDTFRKYRITQKMSQDECI